VPPKDVRVNDEVTNCAVCGRTLLRGELAEIFLAGGERRPVCDLCTARATHQGWIREAAGLEVKRRGREDDEHRPLRGRLKGLRSRGGRSRASEAEEPEEPPQENGDGAAHLYDPKHDIHAVPTSGELKAVRALELFNASDHPRTIAGVARSLGAPAVTVRPVQERPSAVNIVVAWELSWYRYEVELADGPGGVRMVSQGNELGELSDEDQTPNAAADERGALALAAG
jgi:hypothetical protein